MTERPGIISRRAFTIVELLIAVAVMITLLSLLTVALNSAMKQAQKTNTVVLMNSMKQGLVQFESDIGYLPPVLSQLDDPQQRSRDLLEPFDRTVANYPAVIRNYYSITSLAEYLLGYDIDDNDGADGLGIRHPGEDGVWGATFNDTGQGLFEERSPPIDGKIYGPYLQLSDDRMLAKVDPDGNLHYPGDAAYETPEYPLVIVDYWGQPIRYYRKPYASRSAIRQKLRARKQNQFEEAIQPPSLADIPCLRPFTVGEGEVIDSTVRDRVGDTTASRRLVNAGLALFSSGPDKSLEELVRFAEQNEDNIVELGP